MPRAENSYQHSQLSASPYLRNRVEMSNNIGIPQSPKQVVNHTMARPIAITASIGIAIIILQLLGIALVSASGLAALSLAALTAALITNSPRDPEEKILKQRLEQAVDNFLRKFDLKDKLQRENIAPATSKEGKVLMCCFIRHQRYLNIGVGLALNQENKVSFEVIYCDGATDIDRRFWTQHLLNWETYANVSFTPQEFNTLYESLRACI